jgi:hypothetical protein
MAAEPKILNLDAINQALAQQAANNAQLYTAQASQAAAQAKLSTFGSQADIDYTKAVAPRFTEMSTLAQKIATKALSKPDFKPQGFTLDEFKQKTQSIQTTAAEYQTKVTGITQTEQEIIAANALISQFSTPVPIPAAQYSTVTDTGTTSELAIDIFRKTIALFMGESEMSKPWVDTLYKSVSKYYKSGATPDESINFALQDVRNNKDMTDFTNRFKGIYALQDAKVKGMAVTVPTIAEYFASESKMGDILKASGLGDLATEDFLGDVLGKGVSVTEFNNRITNIFNKIDFAPEQVKSTIQRYYPYVDRISLAKALATGEKGAAQLAQDVAGYEVLAAAESQGLGSTQINQGLDLKTATDYARSGLDYQTALGKFSQIAQALPVERKLAEISNRQSIGQVGLERATINKSAIDLMALQELTKEEEGRFQGRSGRFASKDRAAGQI